MSIIISELQKRPSYEKQEMRDDGTSCYDTNQIREGKEYNEKRFCWRDRSESDVNTKINRISNKS